MDKLEGRTAVVTGAASGIGFGLAARFAAAGMKVVLADVEADALDEAADKLRAGGSDVLAVRTDVADGDSVDALAAAAVDAFGSVHVLCNNAGVGTGGSVATLTTADWEWVLGVNLWGVIHGLRAFLPGMIAHGEGGHVVNTASMAGLISGAPMMAPYSATKFAVVAISESLHHELGGADGAIGVSVLCPGLVDTRILRAERNRPGVTSTVAGPDITLGALLGTSVPGGVLEPSAVADQVHDAIIERRFYVITHPSWLNSVASRMQGILDGRDPATAAPG